MSTNTYTFIIGSADDFESLEALIDYVEANHDRGMLNYSIFEFDEPADLPMDTITMIGRGMAFSNDWCMDDTFSTCIRGAVGI